MNITVCTSCKKEFSIEGPGEYICPHCSHRQIVQDAAGPRSSAGTPWERRQELGLPQAVLQTWTEVCLHPTRFFQTLSPQEKVGEALTWGLFLGSAGIFLNYMWEKILGNLLKPLAGDFSFLPFSSNPFTFAIALLVFAVIATFLQIIVSGAVLHVSLAMLGGRKEAFPATLKLVAYAQSPLILAVIPGVGGICGGLWSFILTIIGAREVHRISTGKAVIAVFLPVIVCCCLVGGALALGFAALVPLLQKVLGN